MIVVYLLKAEYYNSKSYNNLYNNLYLYIIDYMAF
jgi:hypothetical protein